VVRSVFILALLIVSLPAMGFGDPTRPPMKNAVSQPTASRASDNPQPLTAIFNRGNKRYAIIEDKIYYVGDSYHGERVVSIGEDNVLLRSSDGTRQLTLIQNIKK
jgi:hypothetical protein